MISKNEFEYWILEEDNDSWKWIINNKERLINENIEENKVEIK